ncbi:Glycosylphosphatidylinositol (GPI) anchor assembly protein [Saitoella coloradoensis]
MFGALILFHAPATPSPLPTLILSLHLAFLTLYPILSIHVHSRIPLSLMSSPSFLASELEVVVAGVGVLVGLWASGAVGLLDWGRGWQGWPVPGVVGACVGLWGGSLVGVVGRGLQSGVEKRR